MAKKSKVLQRMPYKIKRGDNVEVLTGKAKGSRGKVLKVLKGEGRVIVEQVNYIFKHLRKSQEHPKGGRIQMEAPLSISNVMLICPHCNRRSRVNMIYEKVGDKPEKRRSCKKCNGIF